MPSWLEALGLLAALLLLPRSMIWQSSYRLDYRIVVPFILLFVLEEGGRFVDDQHA